jgi:hypothetical protein
MPWADDTTNSGPDLPRWGRYVLRARLGEGAQGAVFCAWDPQLECDVALKVVSLEGSGGAVSDSMLREARALARVRNTHVVNVYTVEAHEGKIGICMELIKGRTLEDMLRAQGRFGAREAATVGIAVGRALAAVHAAGLVHRDVKARNVMREDTGRIVLMDFGMGRDHAQLQTWGGGDLAGTPLYMAPEVCAGGTASHQSDIYGVGVLLYHLVTAKYPIEGDTFDDIARAHRAGRRKPLVERRPDLPDRFIAIVDKALAPDPSDRYPSAGHLVHDLVATERAEYEDPAPRPILQRVASVALTIFWLAIVLTLLGFITSMSFNVTLERTSVAAESPIDWAVWGIRSLLAPVFNMAQVLLVPIIITVFWRLLRRLVKPVDRWSRRISTSVKHALIHSGLDAPHNVAYVAAGLSLIALIVVSVIHWNLISTLIADFRVVSAMTPEQIALLSRDNKYQHFTYRWNLDWLLVAGGWAFYRLWKIRRARPLDVDTMPLVALALTLSLATLMWAAPYRLFFQSDRPRLEVAGERCYDLGRGEGEVLIYCPGSAQPKVRRVAVNTPGLRDTGITESIFAPK